MTPEKKAKKYDEALRRARKLKEDPTSVFYEYSPSDGDTIADYIFPELKESEDERIRKAIISGMTAIKNNQKKKTFADIPIDDCIAWLEKQGDKDELIEELDKYKAKYTQEVLEKHLRAMNKDDERLRKTTIAFLKDFADKGYENAIECIDWLEKQSGQKPQGKSALEAINEEKIDNQFCAKPVDKTVEEYNITGIGSKHAQGKLGEMIKNLKSINERLEQKITSSKEDETSIAVNNPDAYKIGFADGEAHAKEEQWKPSDEQIKHLTYVVYDAKHKNDISTYGYEPYFHLSNLLMQLKRLKG